MQNQNWLDLFCCSWMMLFSFLCSRGSRRECGIQYFSIVTTWMLLVAQYWLGWGAATTGTRIQSGWRRKDHSEAHTEWTCKGRTFAFFMSHTQTNPHNGRMCGCLDGWMWGIEFYPLGQFQNEMERVRVARVESLANHSDDDNVSLLSSSSTTTSSSGAILAGWLDVGRYKTSNKTCKYCIWKEGRWRDGEWVALEYVSS